MELYLNLAMNQKTETEKCSVFLYIIGTEGREIYNTFNVVEGEQNKIQPLFDAFDGYCKPKENITVERYRFNSRNQSKTETIDQYVTELRVLAKTCKFGNLQDGLLRDLNCVRH